MHCTPLYARVPSMGLRTLEARGGQLWSSGWQNRGFSGLTAPGQLPMALETPPELSRMFLPLLTPQMGPLNENPYPCPVLDLGHQSPNTVSPQSPLFTTRRPCKATCKPWPYSPALCPHTRFGETQGVFGIRGPGPRQGLWGTGVGAPSQSRDPSEVGSGPACTQGRRGARTVCDPPLVPSPREPVGPGAGQREGPHSGSWATASWDGGSGGSLEPLKKKDAAHTFLIRNSLF
ncbi:hypothetical protein HJG60_011608 [Phyllostomus discolor]|uniref:Uncharacterized protein n=1 Tax=Phyllostomus discolor TaxID=89673 RepID=A0A833ZW29_9CHIR|nr:hypothetical protein HJG60_011608 [Phyllostomus discolor]